MFLSPSASILLGEPLPSSSPFAALLPAWLWSIDPLNSPFGLRVGSRGHAVPFMQEGLQSQASSVPEELPVDSRAGTATLTPALLQLPASWDAHPAAAILELAPPAFRVRLLLTGETQCFMGVNVIPKEASFNQVYHFILWSSIEHRLHTRGGSALRQSFSSQQFSGL